MIITKLRISYLRPQNTLESPITLENPKCLTNSEDAAYIETKSLDTLI